VLLGPRQRGAERHLLKGVAAAGDKLGEILAALGALGDFTVEAGDLAVELFERGIEVAGVDLRGLDVLLFCSAARATMARRSAPSWPDSSIICSRCRIADW
jgi:hypothetical protein